MNTRFAHLNPDRRKVRTMGDGEETVVSDGSLSAPGAPFSQTAMDMKKLEVRAAEERRRALELELELEKLRASRREENAAQNATVLERSDARAELCRYSKWLSGALPKFPAEAEVPVWFEAVETHSGSAVVSAARGNPFRRPRDHVPAGLSAPFIFRETRSR
ncbi:hypothetical protein HPB48_021617 [Haemaphysalis longicornis]|uniref:Uncharacterized protein n=1 Tax=Haemaphysalis longicornis TaxID=44386 RepID=A0A9J6FTA0_HAELO|nr:hypothetical protein HPB48_021617 [Haemaphysalis longicornis]